MKLSKFIVTVIAISVSSGTLASQVLMDAVCHEGASYGGMQKTGSYHQVNIENSTEISQTVHIKLTNQINGPWAPEIKEWDQSIAPHTWYHSGGMSLVLQFHERNPSLWITTAISEVTGFVSQTVANNCYYRVLKD